MPLVVDLADSTPPPKYQQIAERAARLRELGMTHRAIGEALCVDPKVVRRAVAWREHTEYQRRPSKASATLRSNH